MNNNHTRRVREDAELEKTYKSMTSKGKYAKPGRPTGSRTLMVIAICVAAVILVSCVLLVACGPMGVPDNAVLRQDITVAGVSVGGMTVKDAENAVAAATEGTYAVKDMVVTVSDTTVRISPATAGITFDVRAAVEAAYLYGQDHPDSDGIHEMDILPYLQVKEAAVREALAPFDEAYNVDASESRYEVLGDMPALTPPETEEDTEDEDALPDVTCQTLVLHKGTPKYFLDMDALYQQVLSAYNTNQFQVEAEPTLTDPDAMDLDAIHEQLHLDPVDAVMDPETFEVTPETYGYTFDLEAAKAAFRALAHGESTELEFTLVAPEVPAKELESLLFRDVLSSYTAYQSSSYARATNLNLACQAVNGTIL